jgi:arginine utilization regulatory protein
MATKESIHMLFQDPEIPLLSMVPVLDNFYEGVMITNPHGIIIYFNRTQAKIDDLDPEHTLGKKVTELYRIDEGFSPTMQCLKTGEPVDNTVCYYRTHLGKMINSIHNVFPLYHHGTLKGSICFVREYNALDQIVGDAGLAQSARNLQTFNVPDKQKPLSVKGNGTRYDFNSIIGDTPELLKALHSARMAASSPSPIMLGGETGTGKELFAQSIHNASHRRHKQYVAINCAAIPENLLEGILFGTARGAFTGAMDKAGIFEKAHGGTLLLDEINSLPMGLQAKLLRVLQEKKIRRVGSLHEVDVDLKIISATNEDLQLACKEGRFRMDLFYRLGVVFILIPPLRERQGDIDPLIAHFLHQYNILMEKQINSIAGEVMDLFYQYHWPGNIRELEHIIEGAMNMIGDHETITKEHLLVHMGCFSDTFLKANPPGESTKPFSSPRDLSQPGRGRLNFVFPVNGPHEPPPHKKNLKQLQIDNEMENIKKALKESLGNAARAAKHLGISPQLLHYKMKKHKIHRHDYKP